MQTGFDPGHVSACEAGQSLRSQDRGGVEFRDGVLFQVQAEPNAARVAVRGPMNKPAAQQLNETPLTRLHEEYDGKMVPFAGYSMPVQYHGGILAEHRHTRTHAGLFDVSHMGQIRVSGPSAAADLETLVPGDISGLAVGAMRYTQFTAADGGILDDLMVTCTSGGLFLVVNATCKDADFAHLSGALPPSSSVELLEDRALLALQGPDAAKVMARHAEGSSSLGFMTASELDVSGIACFVSRSGYTGEDGFEISVVAGDAEELARLLLAEPEVEPIGLGARDSLRLEAGLCLYGHDIDRTTTPVEAALSWSIGKRRRERGGFPGVDRILRQLKDGAARKRVGISPEGRAPAREHTEITAPEGETIGEITSGGFGPTVESPVAMGYVANAYAQVGTAVALVVRGKARPGRVAALPFTPHRYVRQ